MEDLNAFSTKIHISSLPCIFGTKCKNGIELSCFFVFVYVLYCKKNDNNPFSLKKQIPAIVQYGLGGLPVFLSLW